MPGEFARLGLVGPRWLGEDGGGGTEPSPVLAVPLWHQSTQNHQALTEVWVSPSANFLFFVPFTFPSGFVERRRFSSLKPRAAGSTVRIS